MWTLAWANEAERSADRVLIMKPVTTYGNDLVTHWVVAKAREDEPSGPNVKYSIKVNRDYETFSEVKIEMPVDSNVTDVLEGL